MNRISRQILQETGAEPDPATLAIKMEMPEDKIRKPADKLRAGDARLPQVCRNLPNPWRIRQSRISSAS